MKDKIKNILFIASSVFFFALILGGLFLEVRVQKRWDAYEQKVFSEYGIR